MGKKSNDEIKIEGETSLFSERIKGAQRAFRREDWRAFKEIFEEDNNDLLEDFDSFKNTAINAATLSDSPKLLQDLLEMLSEQERWLALTKKTCEEDGGTATGGGGGGGKGKAIVGEKKLKSNAQIILHASMNGQSFDVTLWIMKRMEYDCEEYAVGEKPKWVHFVFSLSPECPLLVCFPPRLKNWTTRL
ncbi:hypothetical protein K1719_005216 [Acacia pycnantha]|nr:hypothetical protein K1719_005216 [Acacia pycnantha]